jgi:nucleotide-binding universal stress UspA family protein
VLIALDESPIAIHATEVGVDLAKALGAHISLIHVIDPKLARAPEGGLPPSVILKDLHQGNSQKHI